MGQKETRYHCADHDKRIAENYIYDEVLGVMFHARSLKDAPYLTMVTIN